MGKSSLMNTYNRFDNLFVKGFGSKVYDSKENEFIDFVSGVAVNCLGHCHPVISKVLKEQGEQLIHISNLYYTDKQNELAGKLTELSKHNKVFFCNSGTEAVEAALKLARKYGKTHGGKEKYEVVYMENSFHGRTLGALSVTGQPKYQKEFKPLIGGTVSCEFNNIDELEDKINNNTCAVIIEPIQGEGGLTLAQIEFLKKARKLCDKVNAILIFDEVQCGIGRLGSFFAYEKFDVIPDIVCMAKGLGGGFPIGAMMANDKASEAFCPGDHGSTFGGNPLACAVSLAVINELINTGIIEEVNEKGKYFSQKVQELKQKHECIDKFCGMGLLTGIKVNIDTKSVIKKCFEKGLLVVAAGNNVIRMLPPLNICYEDIDKAFDIFDEVLFEL